MAAGLEAGEVEVVPVHEGARPAPQYYRAALITGSPAMVTDREPWSEDTAAWLREAAAAGLPMFGVCYGHQLLAHALGGKVGYNPTAASWAPRPWSCAARPATTWTACPPASRPRCCMRRRAATAAGAAVLARSDQDPHQMFRVGPNVFSTQFHPEFGPDFVRAHLERKYGGKPGRARPGRQCARHAGRRRAAAPLPGSLRPAASRPQ